MIRKLGPSRLLTLDVNTKSMRALEWGLTAASVAYAIYDPEWYWIAFAVMAAIMTAINPTSRIQSAIRSRFVKPAKSR